MSHKKILETKKPTTEHICKFSALLIVSTPFGDNFG